MYLVTIYILVLSLLAAIPFAIWILIACLLQQRVAINEIELRSMA